MTISFNYCNSLSTGLLRRALQVVLEAESRWLAVWSCIDHVVFIPAAFKALD